MINFKTRMTTGKEIIFANLLENSSDKSMLKITISSVVDNTC